MVRVELGYINYCKWIEIDVRFRIKIFCSKCDILIFVSFFSNSFSYRLQATQLMVMKISVRKDFFSAKMPYNAFHKRKTAMVSKTVPVDQMKVTVVSLCTVLIVLIAPFSGDRAFSLMFV